MREKDKGLIDGYDIPLSHAIICYYYKSLCISSHKIEISVM